MTATFYKVTALWATQDGSLLLWSTLLSLFASAVLFLTRRSLRDIAPWATAVRRRLTPTPDVQCRRREACPSTPRARSGSRSRGSTRGRC